MCRSGVEVIVGNAGVLTTDGNLPPTRSTGAEVMLGKVGVEMVGGNSGEESVCVGAFGLMLDLEIEFFESAKKSEFVSVPVLAVTVVISSSAGHELR